MRHDIRGSLAVLTFLVLSASTLLAQGLGADEFEAKRKALRGRFATAGTGEKAAILAEFQQLRLAQPAAPGALDEPGLVEALTRGAGELAAVPVQNPDASGTGLGSTGDEYSMEELDRFLGMPSIPRPGPVRVTTTRAQIRREALETKFQVGTGLPAKPNAVTPAEFDEIARLHENIFQGTGNVSIDTTGLSDEDAQKYKDGLMDLIAALLQTHSGRQVLRYLSYGYKRGGRSIQKKVVFRPGQDRNGNGSLLDDLAEKATPRDNLAASVQDDKGTPGAGSDVTVEINPFVTSDRADVVLMHELVHAMMHTQGRDDYHTVSFEDGVRPDVSGMKPLGRYEHQAVGIGLYENNKISENEYRRERRLIGAAGVAALPGDAQMEQRHSYRRHVCGSGTCGR